VEDTFLDARAWTAEFLRAGRGGTRQGLRDVLARRGVARAAARGGQRASVSEAPSTRVEASKLVEASALVEEAHRARRASPDEEGEEAERTHLVQF